MEAQTVRVVPITQTIGIIVMVVHHQIKNNASIMLNHLLKQVMEHFYQHRQQQYRFHHRIILAHHYRLIQISLQLHRQQHQCRWIIVMILCPLAIMLSP